MLNMLKEKFKANELVNDPEINKLEKDLNELFHEVYKFNPELSNKLDDLCGEIASAYVDCCFKNGVKYGLKL